MLKKRKQFLSLIEVLIAFALAITCILPLIYPHVFMIKTQNQFIRKIELDNVVNVLYGEMIVALQLNRVPWNDIVDERRITLTEDQIKAAGYEGKLPYKGSYQFLTNKKKSNKEGTETAHLIDLTFTFIPDTVTDAETLKKQTLNYRYQIFLVQGQEASEAPEEEAEENDQD